jgi:cytochrome bd ubiquinol oxidase subunit II
MPAEVWLGGAMLGALTLYFLFGGADFGGGVWDLLASGPRRREQRKLIEQAIGPIWEANHVWLILVLVILFSGFPPAFAALSIAFHVPLTILLVGIVLRGSTFAFRSFDAGNERRQAGWGLLFSVASLLAPVLLGVVVGAVASGRVEIANGQVASGFFAPWMAPFPLAVGALALALCAYLAATFLSREAVVADNLDLADDFRRRAIVAGVTVVALGLITLVLTPSCAPRIFARLIGSRWSIPFFGAAAAVTGGAFYCLVRRNFRAARLLVAAEVTLVLGGWAAAQYPYLIVDDLTLSNTAAPPATLRLLLIVLIAGIPVLVPSLYALFRVFKQAGASTHEPPAG